MRPANYCANAKQKDSGKRSLSASVIRQAHARTCGGRLHKARFAWALMVLTACLGFSSVAAQAQDVATGSLDVIVQDASGAVLNGAQVTLRNLATNNTNHAQTKAQGNAVLLYLKADRYTLDVTKDGFASANYPQVTIQNGQITDVRVTLKIGSSSETVTVSGDVSPIFDTTGNTIATTLDIKQVQDLPIEGRDITQLAFLVPGAVDSSFNNLPGGALNVGTNGFSTLINRNKSGGFVTDQSSISNRVENISEMTVQTSELDASQGGTAAMNIGFTTNSGTNKFHGQMFEDYRNDALNANSWVNNYNGLRRNKLIINDFGASVGGPALRDKMFFFTSLANRRIPGKASVSTPIATPAALAGNYTYVLAGSSATQTVNVLQVGGSTPGCANCPSTVNSLIAADLSSINSTYNTPGTTITSADLNHNYLNFESSENTVERYATLRLDYNLTPTFRLTGAVNQSNQYLINQGEPPYPGQAFASLATSVKNRNYQVVTGFDWNPVSSLFNSFRVGYLYTGQTFNSQGINTPTANMMVLGQQFWGFGLNSGINGNAQIKGGYLYPVLSARDTTTWVRGPHTLSFGVQATSETDHYYNTPLVPYIYMNSLAYGDPAATPLYNAVANGPPNAAGDVGGLYATLTGRLNSYYLGEYVNTATKQYQTGIAFNLHERLTQSALFVQDQWKVLPTLTFNVGLRWDFAGTSTDETGFYTHPDLANLWGPSGVGNLFKPGTLSGVQNPVEGPHATAYAARYVLPQPNIGFAWNPHQPADTFLGRFLGQGKTVIRGSYTFKNYTEGAQNFWNFGSNGGSNYFTYFQALAVAPTPGVTPGAGYFNAGSLNLGAPLPPLASTSPAPYNPVLQESAATFTGNPIFTFDPNIKQPYIESWTLGIQRQVGSSSVLEIRYLGNVAKRQWMLSNFNETNIFENGFLNEFQNAQANLAASGGTTFAGAKALPILTQAFANAGGASNFTNGQFIYLLQTGQAGAFAGTLASQAAFFCSLVGANFSPCGNSGGTYPINFFQANPFATGAGIYEMKAQGSSNYNSLQIEFRQAHWHGMQFDANYTLSKSLGTSVQGSETPGYYGERFNSAPGYYTERNHQLNYFPSSYDVRNVFHLSGTYDLPFGRGKMWLNHGAVANSIAGGWTVGTILTYQSGDPQLLTGGTATFNNESDSGIDLTGVTAQQLQKQMRVREHTGYARVSFFDPKYTNAAGTANPTYIIPHQTAGTYGQIFWLHTPKLINTDMSVNKTIPLYREVVFKLQGEFINVFNHPTWGNMNTTVQSTSFGTAGQLNAPRNIELRANVQF